MIIPCAPAAYRTEVVRVLDRVSDQKEGGLLSCTCEDLVDRAVSERCGYRHSPLMVQPAGELVQLAGIHPLDRHPRFLRQPGDP